ncbi:MAG: DUF4116 domain-containing protein [Candidatus Jorgensenbacteria bacterium]|nr:DUF4116 domain-containing protein [Candidatus Jorgensenbacteria bacterium]
MNCNIKVFGKGNYEERAKEVLKAQYKAMMLNAVRQNGLALQYAKPEIKNDTLVVLEAVKQNPFAFQHASIELRSDFKFLVDVANVAPEALKFAAEDIKKQMELAK